MFDYMKRLCIALVLAVFIGALFLGASTVVEVGMNEPVVKKIESGDSITLRMLNLNNIFLRDRKGSGIRYNCRIKEGLSALMV